MASFPWQQLSGQFQTQNSASCSISLKQIRVIICNEKSGFYFKRGTFVYCFSLKCRLKKEAGKSWFPIEHMAISDIIILDRQGKEIN